MMKPFYLLITGVSLFSLLSAHADPIQANEAYPSLITKEAEPVSASVIDEELALLDEQMEEFEDEILALEEELKRDAEAFNEGDLKQEVVVELPAAQEETFSFEVKALEGEEALMNSALAEQVASSSEFAPAEPNAQEAPSLAQGESEQSNADQSFELAQESHAAQSSEFAPTEPEQNSLAQLSEEVTTDASQSDSVFSSEMVEQAQVDEIASEVPVAEISKQEVVNVEEMSDLPALLNIDATSAEKKNDPIEVNIQQAFAGSPIIYTVLFGMSVFALCVWLYSLLSLRKSGSVSELFLKNVRNKLNSNQFEDALALCNHQENLISKMVASGILARRHGLPIMIEAMKAEGKRASIHFWQRIGLLNDVAIIAPMLGLLGTVLGMFYAFYDINRSIESISTLFDGLGVSVGTTVAGLIVAILALLLHSFAKYRLVRVLATVENEAQTLATLIDDRTAEYKG